MTDRLGWATVGLGNVVSGRVAPALRADPASSLVAAVSRDQQRAADFVEGMEGARPFTDLDEALSAPGVDALFIGTPNSLHAGQVRAAARAGVHVLCDKPLATSLADARGAVEACADAGVHLGMNFHSRYLDWVDRLRDLLASGAIGTVETVEMEVSGGRRELHGWRRDPALAGLGTIYNIGVHGFDLLRVLLADEPRSVYATFERVVDAGGLEDEALVLLRFVGGPRVYVNVNQRSAYPENRLAIFGSEGRVLARGLTRSGVDGEMVVHTAAGTEHTSYEQPAGRAHARLIEAFTRAVLEERPPVPSGADGLASAVLCAAIARSAEQRREVDLDEFAA